MRAIIKTLVITAFATLGPVVALAQTADEIATEPSADPPKYTIREAFPPRYPANPTSLVPKQTIYGHLPPPYPRYVGDWGTGWTAWKPSGGVDGLGYWYQYHTHVPGLGVKYYRGPVARYYPGPYGVSPATGFSHYGYGPLGW